MLSKADKLGADTDGIAPTQASIAGNRGTLLGVGAAPLLDGFLSVEIQASAPSGLSFQRLHASPSHVPPPADPAKGR